MKDTKESPLAKYVSWNEQENTQKYKKKQRNMSTSCTNGNLENWNNPVDRIDRNMSIKIRITSSTPVVNK